MQIRILPLQFSSAHALEKLHAIGLNLDESRILRIDLAWEMFYGRSFTWEDGELFLRLPSGGRMRGTRMFMRWIRSAACQWTDVMARSLNRDQPPVLVLLPPCTPEVEEFISRQLSFYSETVVKSIGWDGGTDPFRLSSVDVWMPPIISAKADSELLRHQTSKNGNESVTLFQTTLGMENVYAQRYTLSPSAIYSRFHSHSDVDELYLILEGSCTFRIGNREKVAIEGDLVAKPKGIGLATQIYNHTDAPVTVLDIEIWVDAEGTDLCVYPDHAEIYFRGNGLRHQVPLDAVDSADDLRKHYDKGYRRLRDGSYVPKEMRGVPPRGNIND